jgi:uncharacterized protein
MLTKSKMLSLLSNHFLELIIFPTEQCNFRCIYCYEDFAIGKMKTLTIFAIKNLIKHRLPELDVLKISWFGGEPLVAKDIIYDVAQFIQNQQKKYPRLKYISGMTTNAYTLNLHTLQKLITSGITDFQISLDGTSETHDQSRVRLNGGKSFDVIWKNLLQAKSTTLGFNFLLRLHLTTSNYDSIKKLIDKIKLELNDPRFKIFLKPIENLGGPNADKFKAIDRSLQAQQITTLHTLIGSDFLKTLSDKVPYVCYAAQPNSLIIRANGTIAKCTVALNDERNKIGKINADGSITVDNVKLSLWTRGIKSQNLTQLACPYNLLPPITSKLSDIPVLLAK